MKNTQQEETLSYFKEHADEWQNKAKDLSDNKVNVIKQRNGYVTDIIKARKVTESILDVGCGTGDLVCELSKQGIKSTGVDFSQDMINIALGKIQEDLINNTNFKCCSIFDFDLSSTIYDVICANGFIEYISKDELVKLLDIVYKALSSNGSLILGSRNRLFNIFSLNSFTKNELSEGFVETFIEESIALAANKTIEEIMMLKSAPVQNSNEKHTKTGIDVGTRFQYSPLQLIKILNDCGFKVLEIFPINIHCTPPIFKETLPDTHATISNMLQIHAKEHQELIPFASSFMLHAHKSV
jgi:2-polyprenyl-3-methyl-5-hydroxy-6-metoxy-1,4-benzoquinol methylase